MINDYNMMMSYKGRGAAGDADDDSIYQLTSTIFIKMK